VNTADFIDNCYKCVHKWFIVIQNSSWCWPKQVVSDVCLVSELFFFLLW